VNQDSRVSCVESQSPRRPWSRRSDLITRCRKAAFPLVFTTTKLPGLTLATVPWWFTEQFRIVQKVPLFPIVALQNKLNASRSCERIITEKVFARPACFGSSNLTDRGNFQLLLDKSLLSKSIFRPETTVTGTSTIVDLCDVPIWESPSPVLP
jgi:hypothetical protein